MQYMELQAEEDVLSVVVPDLLLTFVRRWAREGEHAEGDVILSLLSHGLMHVRLLQNLGPELNNMILGITKAMAESAPSDATIVEVQIHDDEVCPKCGQVH